MTKKTAAQRFLEKVQMPESNHDCWIWAARTNEWGYGTMEINGKSIRAHRLSYLMFNGDLIPGKVVMHTCDNPVCVNPNHLRQGTHKDNSQDMVDKGRSTKKTHCKQGHPLEGNNIIQDAYTRKCRECHNARRRAYRLNKKQM